VGLQGLQGLRGPRGQRAIKVIPASPVRQAQQVRWARQAQQAPKDPLDLGDRRGLLEILHKGEAAQITASEVLDYGFLARLPSLVGRLQFAKMSQLRSFASTLLPK
jgi:hypothetical protein